MAKAEFKNSIFLFIFIFMPSSIKIGFKLCPWEGLGGGGDRQTQAGKYKEFFVLPTDPKKSLSNYCFLIKKYVALLKKLKIQII